MRLKKGQKAPLFEMEDINQTPVALKHFAGQKILLSFYRFSSCPLCNLRVHKLIQKYAQYEAQGLHIISFWQSSAAEVLQQLEQQKLPFSLIADPHKQVYKLYGVENSWKAAVKTMILHPQILYEALHTGFRLGVSTTSENNVVPADFLLNTDLTIYQAYYGSHIGDHLPFTQIEQFLGIPAALSNPLPLKTA